MPGGVGARPAAGTDTFTARRSSSEGWLLRHAAPVCVASFHDKLLRRHVERSFAYPGRLLAEIIGNIGAEIVDSG